MRYNAAMAAFEYSIYTKAWGHGMPTDPILEELNKRGAEGWELVGMTRDESPEDDHDDDQCCGPRRTAARRSRPSRPDRRRSGDRDGSRRSFR